MGATKLCRMAYDNFLIDKRVVDRNIAKGLVDPEELKRHIEALPDRESNCVHVSLDGSQPEPASDQYDESIDDEDDDEDEDDEPTTSDGGSY